MKLTFLGAAGTVTGSRFLFEHDDTRILVDCGLFQGLKKLRERNWAPFPIAPSSLSAVILTHAHVDHSGYLPVLVRNGFRGPVHCTPATADLCGILLPDAAHLQEEEAAFANRHGYSRHRPAMPLFTQEDARQALERLSPVGAGEEFSPARGVRVRYGNVGHILGAACVHLDAGRRRVVFSGDVGRRNDPVMRPPEPIDSADYLVLESTYGDRRHPDVDPADAIAEIVNATVRRSGTVLIPSFAVGRAQVLLHLLARLRAKGTIPDLPVYLDSPMAIDATDIFLRYPDQHRLSVEDCRALSKVAICTRTVDDSKAAMYSPDPKIIISASGMATGGRVLHHLKHSAGDARNHIAFAGYQVTGTRGAAMLAGADTIKIHGDYTPVRARVTCIDSLSAHADYRELLDWVGTLRKAPRATYIVHGEPVAQDALRLRLKDELRWNATLPEMGEAQELN